MVILGVVVGLITGVLLSLQRRLPWPARILLVSVALVELALASDRILNQEHDTAQPWLLGMMAAVAALTAMNIWQMIEHHRNQAHRY